MSKNLDPVSSNNINAFILDFANKVEKCGFLFSPRRCAMMKRCLDILTAIDIYFGQLNEQSMLNNFAICSHCSWNYLVTDEDTHTDVLTEAFNFATTKIKGSKKNTTKQFSEYKAKNISDDNTVTITAPAKKTPSSDDDMGELEAIGQIIGTGLELFTVGFYEMVIKGNSGWKSKMKINQ